MEGSKDYNDCPTRCKFSSREWVLDRTEFCEECAYTVQRKLFDKQFGSHVETKFGEEVAKQYKSSEFLDTIRKVLQLLDLDPEKISARSAVLRAVYLEEREWAREQK